MTAEDSLAGRCGDPAKDLFRLDGFDFTIALLPHDCPNWQAQNIADISEMDKNFSRMEIFPALRGRL
ncbi:hypothetical protein [Roseovarius sp. D22-M7]|uniref:hypothetical protein n=1 Tax=Roseovarius sp. D22-M7 TaxID=3127116 RepID=UPI0030101FA5